MESNLVSYNVHSAIGVTLMCTLPAPHRTDVKALAEPVEKFAARAAQHAAAGARLRAASGAVERVKAAIDAEAAEAAEDGGEVDTRKLVKRLRAAEDELDAARIEMNGRDAALRKAHAKIVDAVRHNAPALRAEAVANLDSDMLKIATAHARLQELLVDVQEHAGMLGLVDSIFGDALPVLRPSVAGARAAAYVAEAVDRQTLAIGEISAVLDTARDAAASKPDVVVPVPGEDTVDETPAAGDVEFTIGGEDE